MEGVATTCAHDSPFLAVIPSLLSLLPLSAAPVPAGNSGAYFIYEAGGRIDNLQRRYVNAASRTLAFSPPSMAKNGGGEGKDDGRK